jgi:uncharacterized protein (DUF1697 family)
MTPYVALLRGINVGGNKKVPMARLREVFTDLGLRDVQTLLNSGNAVFISDDSAQTLEPLLEKAILTQLDQSVRCLVRDLSEVDAVIDANPLPEAENDGSHFMAVFTASPPDPSVVDMDPDNIRIGDRVVYQWCREGVLQAPDIKKVLGKDITGRNWNTVRKIAGLLHARA